MTSKEPFPRLRAAAIDERLQNPIIRKEYLGKLLKALQSNSEALCDAAITDQNISKAEATAELYLTLSTVRDHFSAIDPEKELQYEYRLAHGKDAEERRKPYGIVFIEPCSHSLTYSAITVTSAAIAAGNCVVLQIENTLQALPKLLKKVLTEALDPDIFDTSAATPDKAFFSKCLQVLQRGSDEPALSNQLISPSSERVVAVVDRTANIEEAAKALVLARFAFNGRSPYAPDIVCVNEFVEQTFLQAVAKHAISFVTNGATEGARNLKSSNNRTDERRQLLDEIQADGEGGHIVSSGENGVIAYIKDRSSPLLSKKIGQNVLLVHAVRSLDDAITLSNKEGRLAATYVFADLPSVKYLSQFIDARVAFSNHVPPQLLIGPMAPMDSAVSPQTRYSVKAFSVPRPQYIMPTADAEMFANALKSVSVAGPALKLSTALELPPSKKRPETQAIGFFEQGIIFGAFAVTSPILLGIGTGLFFGYRAIAGRYFS